MGRFAEQPKQAPHKTIKNKGVLRRKRMYMAVMALFLIWAGSTLWSQHVQIQNRSDILAQKRTEQQAVQDSWNKLNFEVERLQDPEYIGQIARKKFGLYPPAEIPIIQSQKQNE
ncbi:FtsB family cell division protein [Paenibacillus dakarensis]|uniref:FtsB family cell division protein n=1 Tax=Paenibacillus dakarensis TaxID=1527293 RepID=UPI0006D5AB02|nr:septum formation initiator family protein [Paenibacillus dakarensis]